MARPTLWHQMASGTTKNRPFEQRPTMDMDSLAWLSIGQLLTWPLHHHSLDAIWLGGGKEKSQDLPVFHGRNRGFLYVFPSANPLIVGSHHFPNKCSWRGNLSAAGHRDIRRNVPSSPFRPRLWTSAGSTKATTKENCWQLLCEKNVAAWVTFRIFQDVPKCGDQHLPTFRYEVK